MADRKTESLGFIPQDKAEKLKGWKRYDEASTSFAKAKKEAADAKEALREEIKRVKNLEGDIDFTYDGFRLTVFRNLQPKADRRRAKEL